MRIKKADHLAMPGLLIAGNLCQSDIDRSFAAVTAGLDVESHFLVVCKTGQASLLNSRDMYEYIFAATIGCDKAEAFS